LFRISYTTNHYHLTKSLFMKQFILFCSAAFICGAVLFTACKKEEDVKLPPIGGFNNSNEVGAADLVAHFPCEEGKERISGVAASTTVNATYVKGLKGNCVSLEEGFVAFPDIPAISASTVSYSMSVWVQLKNNRGTALSGPTVVASLSRTDDWVGNFNLLVESAEYTPSADSMFVKGVLRTNETGGAQGHDNVNRNAGAKEYFKACGDTLWTQLVLTWDGATSRIKVYGNGELVSNPDYEVRKGPTGLLVGDLGFLTPTQMVIGGFATLLPGRTKEAWQTGMTGKADEVRLWKKALSLAEINALYQLEKAGR
jgi:Concanavalin A-like lectin/glucanases superfamily